MRKGTGQSHSGLGAWYLGTGRAFEKPEIVLEAGSTRPRRHRGQAHPDLWT